MRLWGYSLHDRIDTLMRGTCSHHRVRKLQEVSLPQARKRFITLTNQAGTLILDFQLQIARNKFLFKPPTPWYIAMAARAKTLMCRMRGEGWRESRRSLVSWPEYVDEWWWCLLRYAFSPFIDFYSLSCISQRAHMVICICRRMRHCMSEMTYDEGTRGDNI